MEVKMDKEECDVKDRLIQDKLDIHGHVKVKLGGQTEGKLDQWTDRLNIDWMNEWTDDNLEGQTYKR